MMDFTQQFGGAVHGSRETCRYPQLWTFTVCPQWLQALNQKSKYQFHLSLSSSKSGWVFVSGHSFQESDKGRAGELGWKSSGKRGRCRQELQRGLSLKCSKVHNLQSHISFYFLTLIFLLSSCNNNLSWGTASLACTGSWPRLHQMAMAVSSSLCSSCWRPGNSSMEWWKPDRGDVNSSLLIDSLSME